MQCSVLLARYRVQSNRLSLSISVTFDFFYYVFYHVEYFYGFLLNISFENTQK